ncbi:MAG: CDP-glucose 4,6-dehydratase [Candidatus Eremiobacteraeota bacterium]|nr:CDP-glucose 4,6-dehydratase [Candidatus Eremiobacteraeota bacterium]MBV8365833.1 CDP-glucose 4,6-dehydratase [Candidatus Eremiobacteraeota bacterium]
MDLDAAFWRGRHVLLTGHTGFKGAWAALWLQRLGAQISGFALEPDTTPSLYEAAHVKGEVRGTIGDIRDRDALRTACAATVPEIVMHMAAQPLVRAGYEDPLRTYSTNVAGTGNVIDAARAIDSVRAIVVLTSDKCYDLRGPDVPHAETDALGGAEPYSASKASAEFVVAGMRPMVRAQRDGAIGLASARAGNVIGGGDWSRDRLIPDLMVSLHAHRSPSIRNPDAVRPWQHVLDALAGYFALAQRLYEAPAAYSQPWNFGPDAADALPVRTIADTVCALAGDETSWTHDASDEHPREADALRLDSRKAAAQLGWSARLHVRDALAWTADWYKQFYAGADARTLVERDIERYEALPA